MAADLRTVTERAGRIEDLRNAVLRAQTVHGRHDPNQALLRQIDHLVDAMADDAALRVRIAAEPTRGPAADLVITDDLADHEAIAHSGLVPADDI